MIDRAQQKEIESFLRMIQTRAGVQISVLTLESLDGETIEDVSIRTAEAWKLGSKKDDNGVLLVVAKSEKKIRIEVGQGLEGVLTDVDCSRIIDGQMVPHFRRGHAGDGIAEAVLAIASKAAPETLKEMGMGESRSRERSSRELPIGPGFILLLIVFWLIFFGGVRRSGGAFRRSGWRSGHSFPGGWGGGGGFSGGGWSGGGGGFSGGGSSGGW